MNGWNGSPNISKDSGAFCACDFGLISEHLKLFHYYCLFWLVVLLFNMSLVFARVARVATRSFVGKTGFQAMSTTTKYSKSHEYVKVLFYYLVNK